MYIIGYVDKACFHRLIPSCCSDVIMELSREIVLFGSEVLNNLWMTLLEQLRINGLIVKEVFP